MKLIFLLALLFLSFLCESYMGVPSLATVYPVSDSSKMPSKLRTSYRPFQTEPLLNISGLSDLRVSGSAQFSEKTFKTMAESFSISPKDLIILDLREESHGFINGEPISWTDGNNYANIDQSLDQIVLDEFFRLRAAYQEGEIIIDLVKNPTRLIVDSIKTEKDVVESLGATYIRLPVTDHKQPGNAIVDQFIELIQNTSSSHWIHMHCKAGRGRTTTFLTMYDIAKNAHHVSFEAIMDRQYLIGGIDLSIVESSSIEKSENARKRFEFIQQFYRYCQEVPDFHISWSEWLFNLKTEL